MSAQITIDQTDMPVANDIINMRVASNLTGINLTQTGSNFTWDFTTLTSTAEVADTFVNVLSTYPTYLAAFSNPFDMEHFASVAISQSMGNIPMVQISNAVSFYKAQSSAYTQVGVGAQIYGVGVPMKLQPTDRIYKFPLTYGDLDTCDSEMHAGLTGFGYFGEERHRVTSVDGWGTLFLPNDTFSVIRVKSIINYQDTIYLDTLGFGFSMPRTATEYSWLAEGHHEPVLQITSNGMTNSGKYYSSVPFPNAIGENSNDNELHVFPVPSSDFINVCYQPNKINSISILDLSGRVLQSVEANKSGLTKIDIRSLSAGVYLVRLSDESRSLIKKIIVQ
jgi:hypothetical protein